MRSTKGLADAALLVSLTLGPTGVVGMLRCDAIVADNHKFDLSKLGGPHSVVTLKDTPPTTKNNTYTLDICAPLKRHGTTNKDKCPENSRVCKLEHTIDEDGKDTISEVVAIAGGLENAGGGPLDHVATRLKTAPSHADTQKEGVQLVLNGGKYPMGKGGVKQQAVIEFLCGDRTKEGTEGEWKSKDEYETKAESSVAFAAMPEKREGDEKPDRPTGEHQLKKDDAALIFNSYGFEGDKQDMQVLRLTWYTKYACEDAADQKTGVESKHWGFFTWFIVLVFLGTASYLIFGSWLNYNRYGARGWDLLPHGDTIRDIPYLLKDWTRSVINTVQGGGSRGGYSAV